MVDTFFCGISFESLFDYKELSINYILSIKEKYYFTHPIGVGYGVRFNVDTAVFHDINESKNRTGMFKETHTLIVCHISPTQ